jgi:uncharacterized membrane protein
VNIGALQPYHEWFVLVHILAAIAGLGANITYVFWLRWAERDRAYFDIAVRGVHRLDQVLTGPAYAVVLLTGIVLILAEETWPLDKLWLVAGIVLYFVSGVVSFTVFVPALRTQLAEGERDPGSSAYQAAARRSRLMAWVGIAIVVIIVWLMVVKPGAPATDHAVLTTIVSLL